MAKLLPQLQALGEHAIQGSLVEVLVTCGTPPAAAIRTLNVATVPTFTCATGMGRGDPDPCTCRAAMKGK